MNSITPAPVAHLSTNLLNKVTVVVVTHELASIFAIADSALFLDAESKSALCDGNPHELLGNSSIDPKVHRFLRRGEDGDV